MVASPANPYRSANAGEFSQDASGRVDIKQYYSAGLAFKNIEPVPQSGFRQMGGTWRIGRWRQPLTGLLISSPAVTAGSLTGSNVVIWTGTVSTLALAALSIEGLSISAGTATFKAQCFIGASWVDIGHEYGVAAASPATRLAAFEPGKGRATGAVRIIATFSGTATVAISAVRAFVEDGLYISPRLVDLTTDEGAAIIGFVTKGVADFWTSAGWQGAALVEDVTEAMLPQLDFYAEADTIGIFHGNLETVRIRRMDAPSLHSWAVDAWPYDPPPSADLGGTYVKTDDKWTLSIRYTGDIEQWIVLTVDGETTAAIAHRDAGGAVIKHADFTDATYEIFAADMQEALEALPNLGTGVTVTANTAGNPASRYYTFDITFGGALSGEQYDVTAIMVNTADAAALTYNVQKGETAEELLFSDLQGWPGGVELVQDRLGLCRIPAMTGAMALSRTAEYFDYDTDGRTDDAARLDRLRSQTTETILCLKESKYLLAFTDRGVYFVTNRTLSRNDPLNFVRASEVGAQPNCKPIDLEGIVYYVAINPKGIADADDGGNQLVTTIYDDVSTSYNSDAVSLLASHLAQKMIRLVRQKAQADQDASRGWILRSDGRLICAQIIKNQEITGFCEWLAADDGQVRDIRVDGLNRLWLGVFRGASVTAELYDQSIFLHDAVTRQANLAGVVLLSDVYPDGTSLWVVPPGFRYGLGPYVVTGGGIVMEDYYVGDLTIGRWQKPRFESMPEVLVTQNDDVVIRPGRIHTAHLNIIDTASIAVGANGSTPRNVALIDMNDPAGQPIPAKTKHLTVSGLPGMKEYTTMVVTQTKPGTLRVKDYALERKL